MANSSQKNSRSYGSRKISKTSKKSSKKKKNRKMKVKNNSDTEIMMDILDSPFQQTNVVPQMQGMQIQAQQMQSQQMQSQLSPSQFDPLMLYNAVPIQKISYEDNEAFTNVKPNSNIGHYMNNLSNLTKLNQNVSLPVNNLQMAQPMAQQMAQQMVQPIKSVPVQNNSISQQQLLSNLNNIVQLGGKM